MLIRVRGGSAGIKEYLEEGIKNGRDYSRDELDERVILEGDLVLANDIIKTMETDGQRYLHITLSFKEDHIDNATLKAITEDFKDFSMKAYQDDEYSFFAEAHLPKIKTYMDKSTGETVERKPHIHVVIPETNLLSGKRLEPFGLVKNNEHYIDAFQEITNEKYNLASPKHHVRSNFNDESALISRHKADMFTALNRETKTDALNILLKEDIVTVHDFSRQLEANGFEVKVRNKGKDNEYLNVRSPEQKKGVNLKENVFQPEFIALPKADKLNQLDSQYNPYRENGDSHYQASAKHHKDFDRWHDTRAYELKYINRRNRQAYKSLTVEQKQHFLTEKRNEDGQRTLSRPSFDDINQSIGAATKHLHNAQRNSGGIESGIRNFNHRRAIRAIAAHLEHNTGDQSPADGAKRSSSDTLSQIQYELQNNVLPDVQHIKKQIDALALLQALAKTHGVPLDKYPISKAKDGSDRVKCGNRNLNVSDFLTKEIHLSWKEAKHYLEDRYLQQQGIDPKSASKAKPEANLIRAAWRSQLSIEREQKQTYLADYRLEKTAIYNDKSLSRADRNIAISIAQMNKVILDLQFKRESREAREQLKNQPYEPIKDLTMRSETGVVVEHGNANYQHKKDNNQSYFVTLEQDGVTKDIWGKQLRTVMSDNNIQAGDIVKLVQQGQKDVVVTGKEKQQDGTINTKQINTTRNDWSVQIISEEEYKKEAVKKVPLTPENNSDVDRKKEPKKDSVKFMNKNLEASRLLVYYPKLIEMGVSAKSITITDKGDKIEYNGKSHSISQLMKVTHDLKPKQLIEELKPIYELQEKDKERINKFKNEFVNNKQEASRALEDDINQDRKPQLNAYQQSLERTISPSIKAEREYTPLTPDPKILGQSITHETNQYGHVIYYEGKDKLVTDRGSNVLIDRSSDKAVEIGLRLSIEKYGTHLDIKGTEEYKQKLISVAVKNKLNISFKDKALNEQFISRKQQFEKGENIITKAEVTHKAQSKQPEKTAQTEHKQEQKTNKGWER